MRPLPDTLSQIRASVEAGSLLLEKALRVHYQRNHGLFEVVRELRKVERRCRFGSASRSREEEEALARVFHERGAGGIREIHCVFSGER